MRVDEPPNKKQKLQKELTDGLSSESGDFEQTRDCSTDSYRMPAAQDTRLACAFATAAGSSEYGHNFVVSPTGRLFVTGDRLTATCLSASAHITLSYQEQVCLCVHKIRPLQMT